MEPDDMSPESIAKSLLHLQTLVKKNPIIKELMEKEKKKQKNKTGQTASTSTATTTPASTASTSYTTSTSNPSFPSYSSPLNTPAPPCEPLESCLNTSAVYTLPASPFPITQFEVSDYGVNTHIYTAPPPPPMPTPTDPQNNEIVYFSTILSGFEEMQVTTAGEKRKQDEISTQEQNPTSSSPPKKTKKEKNIENLRRCLLNDEEEQSTLTGLEERHGTQEDEFSRFGSVDDILEDKKIGTKQKVIYRLRNGRTVEETDIITQNKLDAPYIVSDKGSFNAIKATGQILRKILIKKARISKDAALLNNAIKNIVKSSNLKSNRKDQD